MQRSLVTALLASAVANAGIIAVSNSGFEISATVRAQRTARSWCKIKRTSQSIMFLLSQAEPERAYSRPLLTLTAS